MTKNYNTPKRYHIVKTRLNDEEYVHFQRRLEVYGMNQSAFIRKALSDAIIRPVIVASLVNDDLLAALGKLTAEYGRIGNNLNQIARHLNEWQAPYPNPRSYKKYGKQRGWMRENKTPETETSPLDGFQKLTEEECSQMQFPFEM